MGYSHYLEQENITATDEEWAVFTRVCLEVFRQADVELGEWDGDEGKPWVTDSEVRFNGVGFDAHETCLVDRSGTTFQSTKTNRKPYDKVVVAVYAAAAFLLGGHFRSDGDESDTQAGRDLFQSAYNRCEGASDG
jgi:hypothetical protein